MGAFEGGQNAFDAREAAGGVESFGVAGGDVLGAVAVAQPGVLGTDHGVVEPGGDGMGQRDLPVLILQEVAVSALENAGGASAIARRVLAERIAAAAGFDADEFHGGYPE